MLDTLIRKGPYINIEINVSYDGRGLVVLSGEDLAVVAPRLDALVQRQVKPPLRPPL